jgi:hypothetical protein
MWDDHERNLDMLYKVAALYPNIEAVGYLVKDGRVSKYKPNEQKKSLAEEITSVVRSSLKRKRYEV